MARTLPGGGANQGITPSSLVQTTGQLSISFWFKLAGTPGSSFPNRYYALFNGAANILNYGIVFDSTTVSIAYTTAVSTFVGWNGPITYDTNWHNVVFTSDFTNAGTKIYLDGTSLTLTPSGTPGTPQNVSTSFSIGYDASAGSGNYETINGSMADVAIWTGVLLTQQEVTSLAKGMRPFQIFGRGTLNNYYPLDGIVGPEPDLYGATTASVGTATYSPVGPPFMQFTPRWPQSLDVAGPAPNPFVPQMIDIYDPTELQI